MVKLGQGTRGAHKKNGNSTYHLAVFFLFRFFFFVTNKKSYALKVKPTLRDTLDLSTKLMV